MPSARAQVFIAVTEDGVAVSTSRAMVLDGAVLGGRSVVLRVCSRLGFSPATATVGKACDWVRRQVR